MEFKILTFNVIQPSQKKKVVSLPPLMLLAVIVFDFVCAVSKLGQPEPVPILSTLDCM